MTQQRIYDYGSLLTQGRDKTRNQGFFAAGRYAGLDVQIVSDVLLHLQPGSFLLPNGVFVTETTPVEVVPPITGVAADYTLTADHADIQALGGSRITYTWRDGILPRSGSPEGNSVALLWLRHPGSTPLSADLFTQPPLLRNDALLASLDARRSTLSAPFAQACDIVKGANVTATPSSFSGGIQHLGVALTNSAAVGLQAYQFRLPLPPGPAPHTIDLYGDIPNLGSVALDVVGPPAYRPTAIDGSVVGVTPTSAAGTVSGLTDGAPAATFTVSPTATPLAHFGVTVTIPPSGTVFLKKFVLQND